MTHQQINQSKSDLIKEIRDFQKHTAIPMEVSFIDGYTLVKTQYWEWYPFLKKEALALGDELDEEELASLDSISSDDHQGLAPELMKAQELLKKVCAFVKTHEPQSIDDLLPLCSD